VFSVGFDDVSTHVALLRGINVGGRNKVAMADLREVVTSLGYTDVATYIQSGNVLFSTAEAGSGGQAVRVAANGHGGRGPIHAVQTEPDHADRVHWGRQGNSGHRSPGPRLPRTVPSPVVSRWPVFDRRAVRVIVSDHQHPAGGTCDSYSTGYMAT
jgi:hypothetical protein